HGRDLLVAPRCPVLRTLAAVDVGVAGRVRRADPREQTDVVVADTAAVLGRVEALEEGGTFVVLDRDLDADRGQVRLDQLLGELTTLVATGGGDAECQAVTVALEDVTVAPGAAILLEEGDGGVRVVVPH